jgi:hypothetical protein
MYIHWEMSEICLVNDAGRRSFKRQLTLRKLSPILVMPATDRYDIGLRILLLYDFYAYSLMIIR